MALIVNFNSTDYKLEVLPTITNSLRQVTFTSVAIDFTGEAQADLPLTYQEIVIKDDTSGDVVLTGYLNGYSFRDGFDGRKIRRILDMELLSPMSYAAKRTNTIFVNETSLATVVASVLEPLTDDGFTIQENNLDTEEVSIRFVRDSVEKMMNILSNKYKFFWYIDENKKIYLNMINDISIGNVVYSIDDTTLNYMASIQPILQSVDYANKVIIKNILLYRTTTTLLPATTAIKDDSSYNFLYPIDISENAGTRVTGDVSTTVLFELVTAADSYFIQYAKSTSTYSMSAEVGFAGEDDDDATKHLLLIRDKDFPDIATGFKWITTNTTVTSTESESTLIPYTFQYTDVMEIAANVGKISTSGIVEKLIDGNNQKTTLQEIDNFARNQVTLNNTATKEIIVIFESDIGATFNTFLSVLKIGSKISVNLPDEFSVGDFIITDTEATQDAYLKTYKISARKANLIENFIDLFRKDEKDENAEQVDKYVEAIYVTDEKINESNATQVWNGSVWVDINEDN